MKNDALKAAVETYEDLLSEPFKTFLDLVGFDGIIDICEVFGGTTLYIPHARGFFKECVYKAIRSEFCYGNYKSLGTKYGLSERTIRTIVEGKGE